jgi:hypothetical protein
MTYTVNTKHVPEQPVISIRQTVSIQELVGYIDRSIRALQARGRKEAKQRERPWASITVRSTKTATARWKSVCR